MSTHIETPSGFACDIDEEALDDYRFVKLLRESEKSPVTIVDVVTFLLGPDEERFLQHVEAMNGGRASMDAVRDELTAIFAGMNAKKK